MISINILIRMTENLLSLLFKDVYKIKQYKKNILKFNFND